jgi:hypothetical protein
MKFDEMIKGVFENEVEQYRTPPLSMPVTRPAMRPATRAHTGKKRAYDPLADIVMLLFIIGFCVVTGPVKNDPRLRSPIAEQSAYIARLIPENPAAALYDFLYVNHSSYEE